MADTVPRSHARQQSMLHTLLIVFEISRDGSGQEDITSRGSGRVTLTQTVSRERPYDISIPP